MKVDKRKYNGGARKGAGRKKGIGLTYDIQKHCDRFIREILEDERIRRKAIQQLEFEYKDVNHSIYVIQSNDYFKIGYSSNFKKRYKNYKTHNPDLKLICYRECKNAFDIEVELHKKYESNNVDGEWYFFNKNELIECLHLINTM